MDRLSRYGILPCVGSWGVLGLPERVWVWVVSMGFFGVKKIKDFYLCVWEAGGFFICLRECGCGYRNGFLLG